MSFCFRAARFVVSGLMFSVILTIMTGCASSRPTDSEASLSDVNQTVTGEDVLMYTGQRQSPRLVSSVTLSADTIYYVSGKTMYRRSGRTKERALQQQPLTDVDSLLIEHGGLRGGAIGLAIGAAPGTLIMSRAQSQEQSCDSIGCSFDAGFKQAGGLVLMLLGGLAGTLMGRSAGKHTETVYRAPESSRPPQSSFLRSAPSPSPSSKSQDMPN